MRLDPCATGTVLPTDSQWPLLTEFDVDAWAVWAPVRPDVTEFKYEETSAYWFPLDLSCPVGQDQLVVKCDDRRGRLALAGDELDHLPDVPVAARGEPGRVHVVPTPDS